MSRTVVTPMWLYTMGVLVLWLVNPELRRLFEWRFGYSAITVISLFPLLSVIPHGWSLTAGGGWRRIPAPLAFAAWLWIAAFGYGLALAVATGNHAPAAYAFANFVFPIGVGLWIAADETPLSVAYARVTRVLFGATTVAAVYGIVQWVLVPPWDAYWLRNVISEGALSFGQPEPFQIRVFSILNSPGPFGNFMAVMLLLALPRLSLRRPLLLAQLPIWLIAFGLSLDRSGWLMFTVGAVVYLAFTPRRLTLLVTVVSAAVLLIGAVTVLPGIVGNDLASTSISDRIATLTDLGNDRSASDRLGIYASGFLEFENAPAGRGLGTVGTATKLSRAETTIDFDSGVLARLIELGLPGALLLAAAFAWLGAICYRAIVARPPRDALEIRSIGASGLALLVALLTLELSGEVAGLLALMLWLFVAFAARYRSPLLVPRRLRLVAA